MIQYSPGEEHIARDAGIRVLAHGPDVYVRARGRALVTVAADQSGPPEIAPLRAAALLARLSAQAQWQRYQERHHRWVACPPPKVVVDAVSAHSEYPGIRHLAGIVTTPILRSSGALVVRPGYDPQTRLYYAPSGPLGRMPRAPSLADAHRAADALLDMVGDIPFAAQADKAAWLAALLSAIGWSAYQSVAPATVVTATAPGVGKTLACDLIGLIAQGRRMPRTAYVTDDAEMRKRIFAMALRGDLSALIDNCPRGATIGWPSLDAALTSGEIQDRVLGVSEMRTVPHNICWLVTGNHLRVGADMARRSLMVRLLTTHVRPEERTGFRRPELLTWVASERPRLLAAALTILSAYLRAGRPDVGCRPWGSYEGWSRVVRDAVVWVGLPDPVETSPSRDRDADAGAEEHVRALVLWRAIQDELGLPGGVTAEEAIRHRPEIALEICGDPSARQLGDRLRTLTGRWAEVRDGDHIVLLALQRERTSRTGVAVWSVVERPTTGSAP